MDRLNKLSGGVKAAFTVALVLVMTGALVLLAAEKAERGFLGVSVRSLDEGEREKLGVKHGVRVADVEEDSAAAKAGLRQDDVIQTVNGEKVRDPHALTEIVRELAPGSTVQIGLWRDGKALAAKAVLGKLERRERVIKLGGPLAKYFRTGAYLGVSILDLDEDLASYFGVKSGEGVLVTKVHKETPATKAGLKSGDVIVQLGDKTVKGSGDVHEALAGLKKGDSVAVTVVRRGKRETLKAEPEFGRHARGLRIFGGDEDIEIDHLELPEIDIAVPEIHIAPPCPPDAPGHPVILRRVGEKLDHVRVRVGERLKKLDERLQRIGEDLWI